VINQGLLRLIHFFIKLLTKIRFLL